MEPGTHPHPSSEVRAAEHTAGEAPPPHDPALEAALEHHDCQDHERAAAALTTWCSEHGEAAIGWCFLASSHLALGDYRAAQAAAAAATAREPEDPEHTLLLGRACFGLGEHEVALEHFRHAVHLAGHAPRYRYELYYHNSLALHAGGYAPAAVLSATKAARFAEDAAALGILCELLIRWGEPEGALELAAQAVERFPEHAMAHHVHGLALMASRRPYEAVRALVHAISAAPGFLEPALALASLFESSGNLLKALETLELYPVETLKHDAQQRLALEIERLRSGLQDSTTG